MERSDGLLLSDDLIFASKITATARAHGLRVSVAKTLEALVALAEQSSHAALILDLHHCAFDIAALVAAMPGRDITAYGSHVDVERLRSARAAGCTRVLPRSAFVEKLEAELPEWLRAKSEQPPTV